MLTRMKLGNFKSWQNLDIELAPITVLFGTNSSGKSSVLQALLMLKQTVNSFDRGQHVNFGGGERDYVHLGSYRNIIYNHDLGLPLSLYLESDIRIPPPEVNGQMLYNVEWRLINDNVEVNYLEYDLNVSDRVVLSIRGIRQENGNYIYEVFNNQSLYPVSNTQKQIPTVPVSPPESCYAFPKELEGFVVTQPHNLEKFIPISPAFASTMLEHLTNELFYIGPLRDYPARTYLWTGAAPKLIEADGSNTIQAIIADTRKQGHLLKNINEWLLSMDLVDEFHVESFDRDKNYYETQVKIKTKTSSLVDSGFGVSQILPVITMMFFVPEGSIVLLEQPELHLHPSAQAKLADLFLHVAETRKLQLIIESHSEHLLRRLQRRIAEADHAFATPDNIKTYFCNIENGESKATPIEIDEYGQVKNWPDEFFGDITGDLEAMARAAIQKVMNER